MTQFIKIGAFYSLTLATIIAGGLGSFLAYPLGACVLIIAIMNYEGESDDGFYDWCKGKEQKRD